MSARPSPRLLLRWVWIPALIAAALAWPAVSGDGDALVVYCAHDSIYADELLADFERESGVEVAVRYDTEATKSLGLVEQIARERARPRCDVLWNNEALGTMGLADAGLLLPYRGPCADAFAPCDKDPEDRWLGFAGRLRVWIVNTERMAATQEAVAAALAKPDLSRVALAKPLYGTTRTHYTVLWHALGGPDLQAWHARTRGAGLREVDGNALVKDLVASGACDLGLTDSDDFFAARDAKKPVAMVPALVQGKAIVIPNTVAIVNGTRRLAQARRLVDFLVSPRAELALARSRSRQLPLGRAVPERDKETLELRFPPEPRWSMLDLADASRQCLFWMRSEYAR